MANSFGTGGGGGGFGGGGFMNNVTTPGSQNQSQGERKNDRPTTIISIPIQQLHQAKGSVDVGFDVYGNQLGQVCVVGIVRQIDIKSTKINYQVEDSTGMIDVTKWADSDENADQAASDPNVRENTYVKVIGTLKDFQGTRSIGAYHVSKLEDPNEITTHMLDAIHTFLRWTKGAINAQGQVGQQQGQQRQQQQQQQQLQQPNRAQNQAMGQTTNNEYTAHNNNNDMDTGTIGGNQLQEDVLRAIKMSNDDAGMSVQTVMMQLGGKHYTEPAIRDAIEWLSTEGHVYSTIDDDHFKSTDS